MWQYSPTELYHHGILGMKWGVRRYQNKDGTLTNVGKRRKRAEDERTIKDAEKEATPKKKKVSELSDSELREKINRLQMEKNYLDLEKQVSALQPKELTAGQRFVKHIGGKVIAPAATEAGKKVLTDWLNKTLRKAAGLNDAADPADTLAREVRNLNLKKQKIELTKYFEEAKKAASDRSKDSTAGTVVNEPPAEKKEVLALPMFDDKRKM